MTMLQLRVVIATAETKSLTAAAKLVNTTQSNASNCIKLLEKELGFAIFLRSNTGVKLTSKGTRFLNYARQMAEMNEMVMELGNADETYRLRFGTVNYYAAAEPFFDLCAEHRDDANNDFYFCNVSITDGLKMLRHRDIDVLAVPIMKHQLAALIRDCKEAGIEMHSICEIPAVIMVRKNHPAIRDGRCVNIAQGSDAMKDYPYVGLRNLADNDGSVNYKDSDFVPKLQYQVGHKRVKFAVPNATEGL